MKRHSPDRSRSAPNAFQEIFRQRADALAGEVGVAVAPGHQEQWLSCWLGPDRYGIQLLAIAEILPYTGCVPVPAARTEFCGLMNLRGDLCPVVNLARLLCIPQPEIPASGVVLLARRGMGFKVDRVDGLISVRHNEIAAPVSGRYRRGLVGDVSLLDIQAISAGLGKG